jgi:histidinol-phosphate/aromatic aminotransferase/cobyric acid decarboxylase-like protein
MGAYGWPHHLRVSVGLPEDNRKLIAALQQIEGKK